MRLGIGTYALAWNIGLPGVETPAPLGVFDVLQIAKDLRVDAVQYADNLPIENLADAGLLRLEGESEGMAIELGMRGLDIPRLQRCIELAHRFGSGFVRLVVDSPGDEPEPREIVDRLLPLRETLKRHEVKLAIENHDRLSAMDFAYIVANLGRGEFGICLDTANSLGCLEGTDHVVETFAPYVVNLHVKDIRIRRTNHNLGFLVTGTAAGQGDLDIPRILRRVERTTLSATIELWPPPNEDGSPPFEEERRMLERSVRYLRASMEPDPGLLK